MVGSTEQMTGTWETFETIIKTLWLYYFVGSLYYSNVSSCSTDSEKRSLSISHKHCFGLKSTCGTYFLKRYRPQVLVGDVPSNRPIITVHFETFSYIESTDVRPSSAKRNDHKTKPKHINLRILTNYRFSSLVEHYSNSRTTNTTFIVWLSCCKRDTIQEIIWVTKSSTQTKETETIHPQQVVDCDMKKQPQIPNNAVTEPNSFILLWKDTTLHAVTVSVVTVWVAF